MSNCVMQGSLLQAGCLPETLLVSQTVCYCFPPQVEFLTNPWKQWEDLKHLVYLQEGFSVSKDHKFLFQERTRTWLPRHSPVITLRALHKSCNICPWLHSKSLFCLLLEEDNFRRKNKSFLKNVRKSLVWYDPAGFFHQVMYRHWPWCIIMPHADFCIWWMNICKQLVRNVWVLADQKRKSPLLSATCIPPTCNYFLHWSLWTAMRYHLA